MTEIGTQVATKNASYVLPQPPRGAQVVTGGMPMRSFVPQRHAEAAAMLGRRMAMFGECQQQFLAELRQRLSELDDSIPEASRAQLKGSLRAALDVLDWCDEVQSDQVREAEFAGRGWLPLDLGALCSGLANELPEVLAMPSGRSSWWGDGRLLDELLRTGIALLQERMGGKGRVVLEAAESSIGPVVALHGSADAIDEVEPATVERFRGLADRLGARIVPGPLGPGSAALQLYLPTRIG
ncbi:MAG: hypothetical protein RL398_3077 [Planctomycetota bacterium]|jgi:hypothetical protein